jgi:hypothetical protein
VGFHAHRVDALFRPLAIGQVVQPFDNALLVEVDGRRAAGLRHRETFRNIVDGKDLLRAEQDRTADGHLSDRSAAPYGHRVGGLDVALAAQAGAASVLALDINPNAAQGVRGQASSQFLDLLSAEIEPDVRLANLPAWRPAAPCAP